MKQFWASRGSFGKGSWDKWPLSPPRFAFQKIELKWLRTTMSFASEIRHPTIQHPGQWQQHHKPNSCQDRSGRERQSSRVSFSIEHGYGRTKSRKQIRFEFEVEPKWPAGCGINSSLCYESPEVARPPAEASEPSWMSSMNRRIKDFG